MTRTQIETLIERAIDWLDQADGDIDLDVGCEDEGHDSDSEEGGYYSNRGIEYADDQRVIVTRIGGYEIAKRYA